MAGIVELKSFSDGLIVKRIGSSTHEFGTQLIVRETQEALFLNQGKLLLSLDPGRYTIDSSIIPGAETLLPGGLKSLQSEIWYLNKRVNTNYRWGTGAPVEHFDPEFGIMIPIGAFGSFESYINDFEKFFRQCVGTQYSYSTTELENHVRPFIQREVKTLIAAECRSSGVYSMSGALSELSSKILKLLEPKAIEFGIKIRDFYIQSLSVISDDPSFLRVKEALAEAAAMKLENQAVATSIEGYKTRRTFDVLDTAAESLGSGGGLGSEIASVGLGAGAGLQFGSMIGQLAGGQLNAQTGQGNNQNQDASVEKLMQLKKLHEAGVLSDDEFSTQKSKILDNF